jgi:hypothetical protein
MEGTVHDISQVKYWCGIESLVDWSGNKYKNVGFKRRAVEPLVFSMSGNIVVRMQEASICA